MSPRTLLTSFALGLLLAPGTAAASQCREVPFAQLLRAADVVFVGRALTWDAELATTFAVERVYKGSVPAQVIVESGAIKYAALAPPDRYLVLAVRDAPGIRPGNLYVHTCGGSQRLLAAAELPKALGAGTAPSGAPPPEAPPPEVPPETTADDPAAPLPGPPADPRPPPARSDPPADPRPRASDIPPPARPGPPADPPGLGRDSYYLLVAPGVLAFDLRHPEFRLYTWGVSGGRHFTGAGHFAAAVGGFFEHNVWVTRLDPERGDRASALHFVRFGPELRIGASNERVFGYALLRLGLDILTDGPDLSLLSTGGFGVQGALLKNRRLLLGAEPMVEYSYPIDRAFFRIRAFIGARF
jgi:hypothetical protein